MLDAQKKAALAAACQSQETTPSEVVRSLIMAFLAEHSAAGTTVSAKRHKTK